MWRMDSLERPWCLERLKTSGEGDDRGRDGWMASPTWWTWVGASSGKWWRTGRPGVLQSMGSPSVGHDWVTEQWMRTAASTVAWRLERTRVWKLEAVSLGVLTSCIWELCTGIWRWLQVVCSSSLEHTPSADGATINWESFTEEEWVGGPREGKHRGSGFTHTFS